MVLASLLTGVAASAEDLNVSYDSDKKDSITLAGSGTTIDNVKNGYVLADSKQAVNGGQLYEVDNRISDLHMTVIDFMNSTNTSLSNLIAWLAGDGTEDGKGIATKASTAYMVVKNGFDVKVNGKNAVHLGIDNYGVNFIAGDNVSIDANNNNGLKFSVLANGKVESGNGGLVSGDTVYQAIRGISGGPTKNALTYDDDTHTSITFHGMTDEGIGARLKNVLDGDVSKGSKDAVNGNQLFERDQRMDDMFLNYIQHQTLIDGLSTQINNHTTKLLDYEDKIDKLEAGYNININGFQRTALNKDNTTLSFNDSDNIKVKYDKKTGLKFEADTGEVEAGSTKLVTAGDVYNAISNIPTDTTLTNKMDADLGNINTAGRKNFANMANEAVKLTQGNNSIITKVLDENGNANYIIDISDGEITEDSDKLVTGKTVYDYMKKNGASVDISNLANIDGSNITVASWQKVLGTGKNEENNTGLITGDTLYKALANVKGTTYTGSDTIAIGDDNSISVKANGKVETGDTGLVTGGQVKEAIAKATENMATDATIQGKVDTKLSNITEEGKQVIKDTVKDDLAKKADQSYVDKQVKGINDTLATKADISYVDTKVSDAVKDKVTQEQLKAGLDKKADADLSNISDAGKQVIKDTMKDDLDKKADQSYVDSQVKDINDKLSGKADTSYVDAALKDKVSKDELAASVANKADKTYVDDQVSNAVKDKVSKTELSDGLATKADKTELETKAATDASNLTDENVKAWSGKLGIGMVQENDTGLVTGDAVYKAISQVDVNNGMISTDDKTIQVGKNSEAASVDFTNAKGEQRVLTGIKTDASDATSAANVGYVQANVEGVYQNVNTAMDRMYNKLDKNMNKGVAGASALAALKPMDFDPDDRLSFAVGYGHYKGANAAALGAFYRPSENTMINAGVSLGNGSNAVNAGVAFKVGKGSAYAGLSKAEMAAALVDQGKKIDSLEKDNAELRQKLEEILAKLK